jgi:hypothetical protein
MFVYRAALDTGRTQNQRSTAASAAQLAAKAKAVDGDCVW